MVVKGLLNPVGKFKAALIVIVQVMVIQSLQAQYLDPTHKTNVNKIDPLFETNLNDYKQLEQTSKGVISSTMEGIKSHKDMDALPDHDKADPEANRLSNIAHQDLQQKGREAKAKAPWLDEYLVDYSKPGNLKYKQSAEEIAAKTGNMMNNILGKLKDMGVDCRTVKGNEIREPRYVIDMEQQAVQDTVYDKHICEELRNQYSCQDRLSLTCKVKGTKWGEWQHREIHVDGGELVRFGKPVFWVDHVARSCFEYKLTVGPMRQGLIKPNPAVVYAIREFLATKHEGATIDNISDSMSSSWYGGIFSISGWNYAGRILGSKDYAWRTYVINYQYREGAPACFEWQEEWNETCSLR